MLRPTNLLRLIGAPIRSQPLQSAPGLVLARRFVATQTSSPSSTSPEPPIAAATTPAATTLPDAAPSPSSSTTSTASSSPSPKPQKSPVIEVLSKTRPALPYLVNRTPSNELPVYQVKKPHGKKFTRVKKVDGNLVQFRLALADALGIQDPKQIKADHVKHFFIVPGHRKEEITKWLLEQGF
ncbi:hypothetical protein VTJ83DRAFT_6173 [Remersonia thermophila]|uniref:Large ribosomal subunit protein mL49 n=1 Tax=Remersonia thermophila TaxID=72144 RepID=A0ABR4D917_9PEZI